MGDGRQIAVCIGEMVIGKLLLKDCAAIFLLL